MFSSIYVIQCKIKEHVDKNVYKVGKNTEEDWIAEIKSWKDYEPEHEKYKVVLWTYVPEELIDAVEIDILAKCKQKFGEPFVGTKWFMCDSYVMSSIVNDVTRDYEERKEYKTIFKRSPKPSIKAKFTMDIPHFHS